MFANICFLYDVFIPSDFTCREKAKKGSKRPLKYDKNWIMKKKEQRRRQGVKVKEDSKYTARKRSGRY